MRKKKFLSRKEVLKFLKGKTLAEKKEIIHWYIYKQLDKDLKIH